MKGIEFTLGQEIEVVDSKVSQYPVRGKIIELDVGVPWEYGEARIELQGAAEPSTKVWVSLRLARFLAL